MIDPYNFISYPVWLSLPEQTRYAIAEMYGILPRGVRQTVFGHGGGQIITDGFIHADLAVITKESMAVKTGLESDDFYVQFKALVDIAEGKQQEIKQHVQQEKQAEDNTRTESTPRRGRPRRKV